MAEETLGSEHREVGIVLNNLGLLHQDTGNYARAEVLFRRAVAVTEAAMGPEHPNVAIFLSSLGGILIQKGESHLAEPLVVRALAIAEKTFGLEHPDVGLALNNLAFLYSAQGEYTRAVPLLERSLSIGEKAFGPNHPNLAFSLNNLGRLHKLMSDHALSEISYKRSLSIRENALGPEHPLVAESLNQIAVLQWARGNFDATRRLLERSTTIEERNLELLLSSLTENRARSYMDRYQPGTHRVLSFHRADPQSSATIDLALTTVLRRKGRVLDVIAGGVESLRRQVEPTDLAILDDLLAARSRLASLVLAGPGGQQLEVYRKALDAARTSVDNVERRAYQRGDATRSVTAPVSLDDVQRQIPKHAALIEFAAYKTFDPSSVSEETDFGEERYTAFVLRAKGEPLAVDLGESASLHLNTHMFRRSLSSTTSATSQLNLQARELFDRLLAPLQIAIGDATELIIAPDGELNLIPFGVLVDAENRHLVERYRITYLTSGRDLTRRAVYGAPRQPPMVFASPDFESFGVEKGKEQTKKVDARLDPGPGRGREFQFDSLPGTLNEAHALEELLGVAALTGDRATEAKLKMVHAPRVLHVATHGFFLEDLPPLESSSRARGIRPKAGWAEFSSNSRGPHKTHNPLTRAGLALAGANRLSDGTDDGILTALELAGIDLWGTKLVVLSACDTGVGEVRVGEGVYGLRRALVLAGAEFQVVSLWKVDDEATKRLMTAYYRRLVAGEGRAEALRQVQLDMFKDARYRHPYFWASFVPIGADGPIELGAP